MDSDDHGKQTPAAFTIASVFGSIKTPAHMPDEVDFKTQIAIAKDEWVQKYVADQLELTDDTNVDIDPDR